MDLQTKRCQFSFISPHNTGSQVVSGGTQQLIENAFYGMYYYTINIKIGSNGNNEVKEKLEFYAVIFHLNFND